MSLPASPAKGYFTNRPNDRWMGMFKATNKSALSRRPNMRPKEKKK